MFTLPPLPLTSVTDASIWLGFSGGLDSSVLLHLLAADPRYRARLRAIHVHHGLNPAADDWARHCQDACAALGIPLVTCTVSVRRDAGQGLEAAARQARYDAFSASMRAGDVLVTAHHLDDQAETFLLRALRASGPDGLAAMRDWRPWQAGWHWRPLLAVARAELLAYAGQQRLQWIEDASNLDQHHDRNFLRRQVMPLLQQRWPHAPEAFARAAQLTAQSVELLAEADSQAAASAATSDPRQLQVPALLAWPAARRARVLRQWIERLGLPALPAHGVTQVERDLLGDSHDTQACFRWQDASLHRWRDRLWAGREPSPLPPDWQADWDGASPLPLPGGGVLQLLGAAALPWVARVSGRRGGERIQRAGHRHRHALKKLLQQSAIPPWQRATLPLLYAPDGALMAVADHWLADSLEKWLLATGARLQWRPPSESASPAR
ncbi:tRNA lysidine(34) synthetase TilS [Pseudoxanthomonas dokdonensis]|uniref:tRNA(Ile)-lysidine synthase n=1 Tax=Pseudoxanthomonas dokdonensis TaxID=344882 RepID=A0A0R0CRY9_9GAMM|nr:tRNA lysidine(34) synthetase TilS [Pseudoxanthomonas dokdonensis]KRG69050.1 hypothetical protein ABB29_11490 [Pseudoxanthomonas dokdonensis]